MVYSVPDNLPDVRRNMVSLAARQVLTPTPVDDVIRFPRALRRNKLKVLPPRCDRLHPEGQDRAA